jgi:hypothetical protein
MCFFPFSSFGLLHDAGRKPNVEFEMILKKCSCDLMGYYPNICLRELRKTKKNITKDNRYITEIRIIYFIDIVTYQIH